MSDSIPLKRCPQCKQEFPATNEYFPVREKNKDGLYSWCWECSRRKNRESVERNKGRVNPIRKERYNNRPDVIQARLDREAEKAKQPLPDVRRKLTLERYAKNHPERIKKSKQDWKARNPDKVKKDNRSPRAKEKAKEWAKAHPERRKITEKKYRDTHKEEGKIRTQRYYSRENSLPHDFSTSDWQDCLAYWNGCCAYCGSQQGLFREKSITAEHFIPVSNPDCPGTIKSNIIPACFSCNASKAGKDATEWLIGKFGKRKAAQILSAIQSYFQSLD